MIGINRLTGNLENGMSYYLYSSEGENKLRVILLNKGGVNYEKDDENGITHLLEHMCLAYGKYNEKDWFHTPVGIINGEEYICTGYTDFDRTVLKIYTRDEKNPIEKSLYLVNKIISGEIIKDEVFQEVKKLVIKECEDFSIRNELQKKIIEFITDGKKSILPMGKDSIIKNISLDDIIKVHRKNFIYNKLSILIIGNIDIFKVENILINNFNSSKSKENFIEYRKKDVIGYKENKELLLEDIRSKNNVLKAYYRFQSNDSEIRGRLIRYFFDRILEQYILTKYKEINNSISNVICTDRRNIFGSDYYIIVCKGIKEREWKKKYLTIIRGILKQGINKEDFMKEKETLKSILNILVNEEVDAEDIAKEYIHNFFNKEAILLIKDDYMIISKLINEISIDDLNNCMMSILDSKSRMVFIRGAYNDIGISKVKK
ncbi:Hypothetical protein CM240_0836 [Clostridium bornimense]|uniref:Peptidase M16 N-terminal domain-containing protein n=1 Tax=Clostridium bornimense TaxID=1216932 RepID=W6SED1_9CLOT|nr:insulinase family protein [Clostridium bornimense]CDM68000.1 Hypothetical protein CM240_0836 [Clostridium bornimense]